MRQHVNPLSSNFNQIKRIPSLSEMFGNSKLNLHLDIGCAAGEFLFDLALDNTSWNYLGIEIREKLVLNANLKMKNEENKNLYFFFGANFTQPIAKFLGLFSLLIYTLGLIQWLIIKLPKNGRNSCFSENG